MTTPRSNAVPMGEQEFSLLIPAGQPISVSLTAVDVYGNESTATTPVAITAASDTTAPAVPTGLVVSGAIQAVVATWNGNTEVDLDHYAIGLSSDGGATYVISTAQVDFCIFGDLAPGTYYIKVAAVDHTGNASTYCTAGSAVARTVAYTDLGSSVTGPIVAAQTTANGKNTAFYQPDPPTALAVNDLWFDTDNGYALSVWDGTNWNLSQLGPTAISTIDAGQITTGTLNALRLGSNFITAGMIEANQITAAKLEAALVLVSKIQTAASGRRVEMSSSGITLYDTDGVTPIVIIPTNGDPVYVQGTIAAGDLTVSDSTTLQNAVSLAANAVVTAQNGTEAPAGSPTLTASLDSLPLTTSPPTVGNGLAYDAAGGSGGATATFWVAASGSSTDMAYEYDATTGALLRTITKTGSIATYTTTLGSTAHISDTWEARAGSLKSQIAAPLVMPRDGTIISVGAYLSGYGGDTVCAFGVWNTSGTLVAWSPNFIAANKTPSTGGSVGHVVNLAAAHFVASGTTIWVGFDHVNAGDGFWWDEDNGSGNETVYGNGGNNNMTSIGTYTTTKPNVYITYQYTVNTSLEGTVGSIVGVARASTYIYVLDSNGKVFQYNQSDLSYVGQASFATYITGNPANGGLFYDGFNLVIVTATGVTSSEQVKFVRFSTALTYVDAHATTGLTINGATDTYRGGYNDGTNYWVSLTGTQTGVVPANVTAWAVYAAGWLFGNNGHSASGVTFDGSVFRGWDSAGAAATVWKYTSWTWTGAADSVFWVAYSWYDSAGPYETAVSPRASITLNRRERLTILNSAIPTGGTPAPNQVRVYMAEQATDPGHGNMHLQTSDALTGRTVTTYTSGGAWDGTVALFPAGQPALLESGATAGWTLSGDGTIVTAGKLTSSALTHWGGTAFPASPVANDHYWRSDLEMGFYYDGTRWLSEQEFENHIAIAWVATNASTNIGYAPFPSVLPSLVVTRVDWLSDVGTTNNGSNYWNLLLCSITKSLGLAAISAAYTNADAINGVYRHNGGASGVQTYDATNLVGFAAFIQKVGSPGSLFATCTMHYRLVAT